MTVYLQPLAIFFVVNSTVGIIGNLIMVLCFFKNEKLRLPCHILITLLCFCDILNLGGEFFFGIEVFLNILITTGTCYLIQLVPITGACAANPLILAIGVDRLLAVSFPIRYRNIAHRKTLYTSLMLSFPLAYSILILVSGFQTINHSDHHLCSLPSAMRETTFKLFTNTSAIIFILVLSVYTAVFLILKTHPASTNFKKVFQSLVVTVALVLIGWVTTTVINIANSFLVTDPDFYEMVTLYSGIPVHFSLSCNVFVFYAINTDYRKTIKHMLSPLTSEEDVNTRNASGLKVGISFPA